MIRVGPCADYKIPFRVLVYTRGICIHFITPRVNKYVLKEVDTETMLTTDSYQLIEYRRTNKV